jgi:hypothetical protein
MRAVEVYAQGWKVLRKHVEPYLTPSKRQQQLKREDGHRALRRGRRSGRG